MSVSRLLKRTRFVCVLSLLLNTGAFAAKLTFSPILYPTCHNAVGGICIDLPGSATPTPPTTTPTPASPSTATTAAAKKTTARKPAGVKPMTQGGITSTSSGVLYYVDTNQEIHQLYWGGNQWYDANIMSSSQSGSHVAPGSGVAVNANGILYYVDTGGDVHQTYWGGSQFLDADLMSSSGSGIKAQAGTGTSVDANGNVYYVSTGQTVHQMWWGGTQMLDADLMASSGSGVQVESATEITLDSNATIYYVATDDTVHKMYWGGSNFQDTNLMAASSQPYSRAEAGAGIAVDSNINIYYVDPAQTIHQMAWNGSQFQDSNLMTSSQTGLMVSLGTQPWIDSNNYVYYVDTSQTVHKMYWGGSQWLDQNLMSSSGSGVLVQGDSEAAVDGNGSVYYVATDQTIHQMIWNGSQFQDINLMSSSGSGALAAASYTISGQVIAGGSGLSGVTVRIGGSRNYSAVTDASGNYSAALPEGGSYSVTPTLSGYTFSPASQLFSNLTSNQSPPTFSEATFSSGGSALTCGTLGAYNPAVSGGSVASAIPSTSGVTFYIKGFSSSTAAVIFRVSGPANATANGSYTYSQQYGQYLWGAQIYPQNSSWPLGGYEVSATLYDQTGNQLTCQSTGYFTVANQTTVSPTTPGCGSAAGTWIEGGVSAADGSPEPNGTWTLTQSGSAISGSVSFAASGCFTSGVTYSQVTGTLNPGASNFTVTASNPSPSSCVGSNNVTYPAAQTESDVITFSSSTVNGASNRYNGQTQYSCNEGTGTWSNSLGYGGTVASIGARNLPIPNGETTALINFATDVGLTTAAEFKQTLSPSPSTTNFEGRIVVETDSTTAQGQGIPAASDGCWFSGSAVTAVTGNDHAFWYVQSDNSYGFDTVGFSPAAAAYYQQNILATQGSTGSCTVTVPTQMQILSGANTLSGAPPAGSAYGGIFNLQWTIAPNHVTVSRNNVAGSVSYSQHN